MLMGNFVSHLNKNNSDNKTSNLDMKEEESDQKPSLSTKENRGKREVNEQCHSPSPRSKLEGKVCSKRQRKATGRKFLNRLNEVQDGKRILESKGLSKKEQYLKYFFKLFDDEVIQDFMWNDGCAKLLDKYLLAMVYVYFRRAELPTKQYNRLNFFSALFLAHDMEEDDEEIKQEIFPWVFGSKWTTCYTTLVKRKDDLLKMMNFRSVVSNLTCLEVIALCPEHPLWQRERQPHHGGASRLYPPEDELPYNPRGPGRSPVFCDQCTMHVCGKSLVPEFPLTDDDKSSRFLVSNENATSKTSGLSSDTCNDIHAPEE